MACLAQGTITALSQKLGVVALRKAKLQHIRNHH